MQLLPPLCVCKASAPHSALEARVYENAAREAALIVQKDWVFLARIWYYKGYEFGLWSQSAWVRFLPSHHCVTRSKLPNLSLSQLSCL